MRREARGWPRNALNRTTRGIEHPWKSMPVPIELPSDNYSSRSSVNPCIVALLRSPASQGSREGSD